MSKSLRSLAVRVARFVPWRVLPLDSLLRLSQRMGAGFARLLQLRDWQLEARGRPQFFKHQVNLGRWPYEPDRWSFTARGVYARENMFSGCKVLDLCCGDGSYSYLFFSDIAAHIDAVDNDEYAISYARRYHRSPRIAYHKLDILAAPWPASDYDVIVWNAAICYFTEPQIRSVLGRIAASGKPGLRLKGMLPRANNWVDHKTEFHDAQAVESLLRQYFATVGVRTVEEGATVTYYFEARDPAPARA
jgi:SAM-dependent methyltransferase